MSAAGTPEPGRASPRWGRLVEQSDEPMFVLSGRRRILYVNSAWERWAGLAFADIQGKPCRPTRGVELDESILAVVAPPRDAVAGRPAQVRRRHPGGGWVDVHFFPWKQAGELRGILGRIETTATADDAAPTPLPEKLVQLRRHSLAAYRLDLWESDVPAVVRATLQARLASVSPAPVLLQGPPGSGKEWLARTIHQLGPRREEFFASLDARTTPPSIAFDLLLHSTRRLRLGAILIRRPGYLRSELQIALEERIAADTPSPRLFFSVHDAEEASLLRPELLARVGAWTIVTPPLRERRADWPRLAPTFLARAAAIAGKPALSISPEAEEILRLHSWPGNFRELDQTLRDAALSAAADPRSRDRIEPSDLPLALRQTPVAAEPNLPLDTLLEKAERRLIELALNQSKGNRSKAARILGVWRPRLLRRIEQLGIVAAGDEAKREETTEPKRDERSDDAER